MKKMRFEPPPIREKRKKSRVKTPRINDGGLNVRVTTIEVFERTIITLVEIRRVKICPSLISLRDRKKKNNSIALLLRSRSTCWSRFNIVSRRQFNTVVVVFFFLFLTRNSYNPLSVLSL